MIHRNTAIIAKSFRAKGEQFHIEQRGSFSSVSVRLIPNTSMDMGTLRFISNEKKTAAYIFDLNHPASVGDMANLYMAANELNQVFPFMKFFLTGCNIVAKSDIPAFIPEEQLGDYCYGLYTEVKKVYKLFPKAITKWLSQTPDN